MALCSTALWRSGKSMYYKIWIRHHYFCGHSWFKVPWSSEKDTRFNDDRTPFKTNHFFYGSSTPTFKPSDQNGSHGLFIFFPLYSTVWKYITVNEDDKSGQTADVKVTRHKKTFKTSHWWHSWRIKMAVRITWYLQILNSLATKSRPRPVFERSQQTV